MKKELNNTVEVVFIIDRSGSMSGLEADTIGGFNATLEKQKKEEGEVLWSTVLFDHQTKVIHDRLPIQKVEKLTDKEYYVRGSTALLDAIGGAIHHIGLIHKYAREEDVPNKTLFVITTDGMENASHQYTYKKVKEMIQRQTKKYGWEFVFLGANMDAVEVAGRMGIHPRASASFINDDIGIQKNYASIDKMMHSLRFDEKMNFEVLDDIRDDYEERS